MLKSSVDNWDTLTHWFPMLRTGKGRPLEVHIGSHISTKWYKDDRSFLAQTITMILWAAWWSIHRAWSIYRCRTKLKCLTFLTELFQNAEILLLFLHNLCMLLLTKGDNCIRNLFHKKWKTFTLCETIDQNPKNHFIDKRNSVIEFSV